MLGLITAIITAGLLQFPAQQPANLPGTAKLTPASLIRRIQPAYTTEARLARASGTVRARIVIRSDGSVASFRIVNGMGLGLDEMAEKSVMQWTFAPAEKSGTPAASRANVEVNFLLRPDGANVLSGPAYLTFSLGAGVSRPELAQTAPKSSEEDIEASPVELDLQVGPDGLCNVQNVDSGTTAAVAIVSKIVHSWRFRPAELDGNQSRFMGACARLQKAGKRASLHASVSFALR